MEGISNEACSLAGHWGLGKLIAFYDDNHISIDGDTEIAFTEDVSARFESLGWHVIWVKNGNTGYDEIRAAIKEAKAVKDKPTMIKVEYALELNSLRRDSQNTKQPLSSVPYRLHLFFFISFYFFLSLPHFFGNASHYFGCSFFPTGNYYHWFWLSKQGKLLQCAWQCTWSKGSGGH